MNVPLSDCRTGEPAKHPYHQWKGRTSKPGWETPTKCAEHAP